MHASKGLEFPVVAVLDGENTQGLSEGDAKNEARLVYIAATRSTNLLFFN